MRTPKVNDILACSWGYDQTNVDFYKVVKVMDKSIRIAQVGTNETNEGFLTGKATPAIENVSTEAKTKRFCAVGDDRYGCRINSFSSAYLWDGQPKYCSHTH